jgi:putative phage-type endonuclease
MIGDARELLPYGSDVSDRQAWLKLRRTGVTASEAGVILGLSRWSSPTALFFQKRGELDDEIENDQMRLGRVLEPYVLQRFTEMTGQRLEYAGLLQNQERPWQLCTPDALVTDATFIVPVEGKTAVSEDQWGKSGTPEIPLAYRAQLLWQMDVIGAPVGYLCVLFLRSGEPRWYQVEWDAEDVGVMRDAALEFLDFLERGVLPPTDASEATQKALRAMYRRDDDAPDAVCGRGLRRSYAAALKAYSAAEDRKRLASNKIRVAMGNSARLRDPSGEIVASRRGPNDALHPARGLTE